MTLEVTHTDSLAVKEISFILNIFYVYDPIELKFSMIVNNFRNVIPLKIILR